ncbi:hypothetical protein L1987_48949 [Smallanthus sonchifolius]|uniref:Uncharacterized protein n=1 Tax=Smallanthus sonchifolius TaxID=185202 RepID=A0ACB9FUB5_9ASTR|nr:hypothetical protein L1987_48949 [Smallanthus sonchifolius]
MARTSKIFLAFMSITLPVPTEPAFFMQTNVSTEKPLLQEYSSSTGRSGFGNPNISKARPRSVEMSINDVSISEIIPR